MERQQHPGITLDKWNAPQHQRPKPTARKTKKSHSSRKRHVRFSPRIQIGYTWSSSEYDRHGCSGLLDEMARQPSAGSISGNQDVQTPIQPHPTPHTAPSANVSVAEQARPQQVESRPKTSNMEQMADHIKRKVMQPYPTPDTALSVKFTVGERPRPQHVETRSKTTNMEQMAGHIKRKVSKLFHQPPFES